MFFSRDGGNVLALGEIQVHDEKSDMPEMFLLDCSSFKATNTYIPYMYTDRYTFLFYLKKKVNALIPGWDDSNLNCL